MSLVHITKSDSPTGPKACVFIPGEYGQFYLGSGIYTTTVVGKTEIIKALCDEFGGNYCEGATTIKFATPYCNIIENVSTRKQR